MLALSFGADFRDFISKRRANLYLKSCNFHFPKGGRQELEGPTGSQST